MYTNTPVYGKLYYDTGELWYEGCYTPAKYEAPYHSPFGRGTSYYKSGVIYLEGQFQHGGLFEGKEYYPSGIIKFDGRYCCRKTERSYYGPAYPVFGKFYGADGALLYEGEFKIVKMGSVGYPRVILPTGFGPL